MGGFIAAFFPGDEEGRARSLFDRSLSAWERIRGQRPAWNLGGCGVLVAGFSRRVSDYPRSPWARDEAGRWISLHGSVLHEGGPNAADRLLRLAEGDAARLVEEVDGFYNILHHDPATGETLLVTDHLGSYHSYVTEIDGVLLVSSSSMILAALHGRRELDPVGAYEFLATGTIYGDRSLFRGIRKTPSATVHRIRQGRIHSAGRWWDYGALPFSSLSTGEAVGPFREAAGRVTEAYCDGAERPLADLTGGYDSRCVLAICLDRGIPLSTVVNGPPESADVVIAGRIADHFGLEHHHNRRLAETPEAVWEQVREAHPLTDGEYDLLDYANTFRVHSDYARRFDLSVVGSGGEVARGYWWELLMPGIGKRAPLDTSRVAEQRYAAVAGDATLYRPEVRLDLAHHFRTLFDGKLQGMAELPNTAQMDWLYLEVRMQRWQGRIGSSTDQIWPALSPFLCRAPLEVALCIRPEDRVWNRFIRHFLADTNRELAALPLENGAPALPRRLSNLHLFLPELLSLGRRAVGKAVRTVTRTGYGENGGEALHLPVLRALWREEEVRELLGVERMRSRELFDGARLAAWLERAAAGGLSAGEFRQFGRLLTLERTLRSLESGD